MSAMPHPGTSRRERAASAILAFYKRALSPLLHVFITTQCKYLPTCSEYAYVAVVRHGWLKGSWLAARRVLRCHPFTHGGHDPVP
jgi:putative membrane protein insertion efficiency factor